jgi:hypothetical protein
VVHGHLVSLEHLVPTVLRMMTTLVPLLSGDSALQTLLADRGLLQRVLVDIPLRAIQAQILECPLLIDFVHETFLGSNF